jgi:cardiolipin synthase
MSRAAQSRPVPGNDVQLLQDGPVAFEAMLEAIAGARSWVHFENYIIRSDKTGWRFARALADRARAGLPVRVLYDWLGCLSTSRALWRHLRDHGVEVRAFNPPRVVDVFANMTRDHRKLVVVDGRVAILGGICIGDEWAGRPDRGTMPWRDTAAQVSGPAAAALDQAFGTMWGLAGTPLPDEERPLENAEAGTVDVQVVSGRPGRGRIFRLLDLLAAGATDRIWITDAYLVVPRRLLYALRNAAKEGVDVRLLVPSTSDVPVVRNLTRIGYRGLLRAGIRIFEWRGAMLHAKTQVADGRWTRVGSSNLNAASLLGNYELDVLVDDRAVAAAMEHQFRRDLSRSADFSRVASRRFRDRRGSGPVA